MSKHHPLYPVNMNTHWHNPSSIELTSHMRDWLLDPSSLTARLKTVCQHFRVELLGQHIEACQLSEANADIIAGEEVLVREVLLYCDDIPHVFARSLLPLRSLTGEEKKLASLGNQSLGQVLFNNPNLIRKSIEISSFDLNSSAANLVNNLANTLVNTITIKPQELLWGRRSVFILPNKPLMVAEIFLPNSFAYQSESIAS